MSNHAIFANLRNTLAYLYGDEISARRVATDAGLDITNIAFSSQARNNWHAILSEAVKTGKLAALLKCVEGEYSSNAAFQSVSKAYLDFTNKGGYFVWPPPPLDDEEPPTLGKSPYKGLSFFDVRDAVLFFGRERLIAELVAHLRAHRFLAVVGASGSGKSSVVRAGLVPALQQGKPLVDGAQPPAGCTHWPIHIITPTAHPLKALAASLTRDTESVTATATLMDDLAHDARSLDFYVSKYLRRGTPSEQDAGERLLLVVDQFEELFTLCQEKSERQAFVDNLLTAAAADGQTVLVITLRADFYAHCAEFDHLRTALERHQRYIGPMSEDELRRAIEEPARLGGWRLEPGLVELLLEDVGNEPGALPLLSHALLETWQRRQGRRLTLAGYQEAGQVQGAIAKTADRIYQQELNAAEQSIARYIFLSLTELGDGAADTRRRVALADLLAQSAQHALVDGVLAKLAKARLVIMDEEQVHVAAEERRAHAEVAHEALIREWPQLRRWLEENRESLRFQRTLGEAAKSWAALGRDVGALYSGLRLQQALAWQKETDFVLTPLEAAFLRASKQQRDLRRGLLLTVAVAILAVLGWLSWGQVNELRYARAVQAVSPLVVTGDADGAKAKLRTADALFPGRLKLDEEFADVNRQVATGLVQAGEILARNGDPAGADAKFRAALALAPPPDTPVYVWVPPGEFIMGSGADDTLGTSYEKPQQTISVDGFWLMRTEVTNAQYRRCVGENKEGPCTPPNNQIWKRAEFAQRPVTDVDWKQVRTYAAWVGGRLPTEVEWEKACRGGWEIPVDLYKPWEKQSTNPYPQRIYPWGNDTPHPGLLNYAESRLGTTTNVGYYSDGASPYGILDMAGNVWEWTSSLYRNYPYDPKDGREDLASTDRRVLRSGSFDYNRSAARCAYRSHFANPNYGDGYLGFRVLFPGP